jgi:hypothetical protein
MLTLMRTVAEEFYRLRDGETISALTTIADAWSRAIRGTGLAEDKVPEVDGAPVLSALRPESELLSDDDRQFLWAVWDTYRRETAEQIVRLAAYITLGGDILKPPMARGAVTSWVRYVEPPMATAPSMERPRPMPVVVSGKVPPSMAVYAQRRMRQDEEAFKFLAEWRAAAFPAVTAEELAEVDLQLKEAGYRGIPADEAMRRAKAAITSGPNA